MGTVPCGEVTGGVGCKAVVDRGKLMVLKFLVGWNFFLVRSAYESLSKEVLGEGGKVT